MTHLFNAKWVTTRDDKLITITEHIEQLKSEGKDINIVSSFVQNFVKFRVENFNLSEIRNDPEFQNSSVYLQLSNYGLQIVSGNTAHWLRQGQVQISIDLEQYKSNTPKGLSQNKLPPTINPYEVVDWSFRETLRKLGSQGLQVKIPLIDLVVFCP